MRHGKKSSMFGSKVTIDTKATDASRILEYSVGYHRYWIGYNLEPVIG